MTQLIIGKLVIEHKSSYSRHADLTHPTGLL
jgi:hypothetical protein